MLKSLKFVQGAVAKKDFVPELTHFTITNGTVTGFNGLMALHSPIPLDIEARPSANSFIKAVTACDDQIVMHMTKAGRLSLKAGKFKAFIECMDDVASHSAQPEGGFIELGENFMEAIKTLAPFMGVDASRAWCTGILLRGQSAYATNNVIRCEYWHGHTMPMEINIPSMAIKELLRIKMTPTHAQTDGNSITFHFEGDRWLRTQLLVDPWPEIAFKIFDAENSEVTVANELFDTIEPLKPFLEEGGRIYFLGDKVATCKDDEVGTSFDIKTPIKDGCFHYSQIMLLKDVAQKIDFTSYPKPCNFVGNNLRGIIMGMIY